MNKNILKLLAALTMVIDHAGLLLFPQAAVLRWIGRISFPLFAFCVGDGCVHTRKPRVYFWRVLGLGLACQIVFAAEELLGLHLRGGVLYPEPHLPAGWPECTVRWRDGAGLLHTVRLRPDGVTVDNAPYDGGGIGKKRPKPYSQDR